VIVTVVTLQDTYKMVNVNLNVKVLIILKLIQDNVLLVTLNVLNVLLKTLVLVLLVLLVTILKVLVVELVQNTNSQITKLSLVILVTLTVPLVDAVEKIVVIVVLLQDSYISIQPIPTTLDVLPLVQMDTGVMPPKVIDNVDLVSITVPLVSEVLPITVLPVLKTTT
jgi:hypothetical protein